jgi:hypothetical protein
MINIILELLSYYLTAVSKSFGEGNARGQAAYLYTRILPVDLRASMQALAHECMRIFSM